MNKNDEIYENKMLEDFTRSLLTVRRKNICIPFGGLLYSLLPEALSIVLKLMKMKMLEDFTVS